MRKEFKWNEHIIKKQIQSNVDIPDLVDDTTYNCILRLDLNEDAKDYSEYYRQHTILEQQVMDEIGARREEINDETEQGRVYLKEFIDNLIYTRRDGKHA